MLITEEQDHVHEELGHDEPAGSSGNVAAAVAAAGGDQVEAVAAAAEAGDDDFCNLRNDATVVPAGEDGNADHPDPGRSQGREDRREAL